MPYTVRTKDGITLPNLPDTPRAGLGRGPRHGGPGPGQAPSPAPDAEQRSQDLRPGVAAANLANPAPPVPEEPHTTAAGVMGAVNRALLPYAGGAALGAAAGAPVGGVGAGPGAIAGIAAVGLSKFVGDPIVSSVNAMLGTKYTLPTDALEDLMTKIGIPEPRTEAERIVKTAAEAAAGAGSQAGLGKALMAQGFSPAVQGVGEALASQPAAQIVSGAGAGAAAQGAREAGAGPVGQLAAGLAGGLVTGMPLMRGASATPPALRDLPLGYRPVSEVIPAGSAPGPEPGAVEPVPAAATAAPSSGAAEPLATSQLNAQAKKAAEGRIRLREGPRDSGAASHAESENRRGC